ncbi:MAG: hypothetical protein ABIN80_16655 [Dyadobacter sp.]|uniref:hypothetical protein n=1 Tax=Dyadobacter sp. TaxID=1914288 RepID=UPI003265C681
MKKCFTSICVLFVLTAFSNVSKAGTYYVINGDAFSLSPAAGSNFFQYLWTIDPGSGQTIQTLDQASGGVLTYTFSDAATSPTLHKISLGVIQVLDGCLSEVVEHTIIVLPKLTVSITADKLNFCTDKSVDATLSATVTAVTGLATYGVTISPFAWKKGGTLITGESSTSLHVITEGVYEALVTYQLPTTGTYALTASKLVNAVVPGSQEILHNLAVPLTPIITLN